MIADKTSRQPPRYTRIDFDRFKEQKFAVSGDIGKNLKKYPVFLYKVLTKGDR